jgi:mannonate dehydratase
MGGLAMAETMRVAVGQFSELSHEQLSFARQLGAGGVQLNTPILPGEKRWELDDLLWLRRRCESYGLRLEAIENTPISFYDRAMLGLPGRDEQIEHYQATIRNLGAADIPILGYHWMPMCLAHRLDHPRKERRPGLLIRHGSGAG